MNLLLVSLLAARILLAQPQGAFSALPPWPTSGTPDLARYPKGTYLFVDGPMGDYVAYFPESLDPAKANSRAFRTVRIPLTNKAHAMAKVHITRTSGGEFIYNYTVTNKRESTYPLVRWLVATEPDDESVAMGHPSWRKYGRSVAVQVPFPTGPGAGRLLMWSTTEQEHPLSPGATGEGFQLRSRFSPGLTMGYFVGGPPLGFDQPLPEAVMLELAKHLGRDREWYNDYVIGPRFAPERSVLWRAAEWHVGLQRLVHAKGVGRRSRFLDEALATLDALIQHENLAVPESGTRARFPLEIKSAPATDWEKQLRAALLACFP